MSQLSVTTSDSKKYLLIFIGVALGYYVGGRLALLLAVAPGYASVIWPSAGLALAALVLWGYRFWPAILLGSFATNFHMAVDAGTQITLASMVLPLIIGCGAALQALVSKWLLTRFISLPLRLDTVPEVLYFLFVVCGLGSTVSASVGVAALTWFGLVAPSNILFNWSTWWVGDGLGALLVSTLIFVYLAEPRKLWASRRRVLPTVMIVTSVILIALFIVSSNWEQSRQRSVFDRQVRQVHLRTQIVLSSYLDNLYAVKGLFESSDAVERQDFQVFTHNILQRYQGFQGIAWNPMVNRDGREPLESILSRELGESRVFTELDPNGTRVAAQQRDSYVVIRYIEPLAKNRLAVGYNIAASELPREALLRAARTGEPSSTSPIKLIQEEGTQKGVVVYFPVYSDAGELVGFASGVFRMGNLMETVLSAEDLSGLHMSLRSGAAETAETLFSLGEAYRSGVGVFTASLPVAFADREWQLDFQAGQRFIVDSRSMTPWGILAVGMLFTGLLSMSLLILTGAKFRSEQTNEDLQQTLNQLRSTQDQLIEAEKLASLGGMVAGFAHELNTPVGIAVTAESTLQEDLKQLEVMLADGPARTEKHLRRMREASAMVLSSLQRAGALVQAFKQVAGDQASGECREFNLYEYLHDVVMNMAPGYRALGHEISFRCPRDITVVSIPGSVGQVLIQLINNSLVHGFHEEQVGEISVDARIDDGELELVVADNGLGIPADVLPKIFDPFFTTRRGRGEGSAGTGLGLHLVYNIVNRQLHGSIAVQSEPGAGSRFTLRLPLDVRRFQSAEEVAVV